MLLQVDNSPLTSHTLLYNLVITTTPELLEIVILFTQLDLTRLSTLETIIKVIIICLYFVLAIL